VPLHVHLSEGANVPDAHHLDREITQKVDDLLRLGSYLEEQHERSDERAEQFLDDVNL
jgi:hypothetical protein